MPENAFDNDTLDYGWGNEGNGLPAWLAYDFEAGNAQVVNAYSIYNSCDQLGGWCDNEYNPMSWRFEATNNDTTWTTLDTIADAQLVIGTKSIFPISNTAAFRKYRLYVTYSSGNSYARITEMELLQGVAACNNNKFEASVANGGDSATLQWKVNGNNAGNGGYVESLANLSNGDVITCVLTANNKCQTTATATSSAVVYKADLISTVNATVCKDSFVVNGVPVSTGGTYTAVTAMASGCDSVVNYVLTVNDCSSVGINDINQLKVGIYPNPNSGIFTVTLNDNAMHNLVITDAIGSVVSRVKNVSVSQQLDLSGLSNGVYFVSVQEQKQLNQQVRLVIAR